MCGEQKYFNIIIIQILNNLVPAVCLYSFIYILQQTGVTCWLIFIDIHINAPPYRSSVVENTRIFIVTVTLTSNLLTRTSNWATYQPVPTTTQSIRIIPQIVLVFFSWQGFLIQANVTLTLTFDNMASNSIESI